MNIGSKHKTEKVGGNQKTPRVAELKGHINYDDKQGWMIGDTPIEQPQVEELPRQAHSPLPWHCDSQRIWNDTGEIIANMTAKDSATRKADAMLIVACVNHAQALAEALRAVDKAYQEMFDVMPVAFQTYAHIVEQALANWEGAK